ncbi:MAG TPA: radical SAM protein [Patescibacteria group bacterium]|nr:radical SAM protein [Patescibacteria group bacterium]
MVKKFLIDLCQRLERLPGENTKPNFCCFAITEECMLRCQMCRKWKTDAAVKPGDTPPSLSQWKQAIGSLRQITDKGFLINFGGGEPLLKEGVLELVKYAADNGFTTNIATNAYLIDEAKAREIADSGLSTINISLDSFREETHDYVRGLPGVYRRAQEAIAHLDTHCPSLKKGICTIICGINLDDILELTNVVQADQRLEWIYFMAAMQPNNTPPQVRWYEEDAFRQLWPQDTRKVHAVLDRLIELKRKGHKIVNQIPQLRAFKSYFANPAKFVKTAECNMSRALHISAMGDVFVCFRWARLGTIKTSRVEDLWLSDQAKSVRRDVAGCKHNCHFLLNCFFEGDFPYFF